MPPLSNTEEDKFLEENSGWHIRRSGVHKLDREFRFKNFVKAIEFVNKLADVAEGEGHHPDIHIFYNKVKIELYTHAIDGLSENDFIVAAKLNKLLE